MSAVGKVSMSCSRTISAPPQSHIQSHTIATRLLLKDFLIFFISYILLSL